jgi:cytochrome oxidase Cu insertion factor (SCO1/SenC/PrrC family)
MAESPKQFPRTVWLGMSLAFGLLGLAYIIALTKMEHTRQVMLPVIGHVDDFTLTNQSGQLETLASLSNRVWVADIIFTRCAGPCPRMTGQMKSLQDLLPPTSDAKLVTLTTDPDFDTPEVLKKYGDRFGADFDRWKFLTGTKAEIAALASGSLKLSAVPVKLEDKHAKLRGVFETGGDGVDWTNEVQPKLLASVHQLEQEP